MRGLFKWLLIGGVVVGIGVGVFFVATSSGMPWRSQPGYRTVPISRGRVETVINSTGTIKPVRSVSVGAFVSGPIKHIYVDFNSPVKEGQLLAEIDPRLLQASLARDEATLKTQEAERDRIKALLQQAVNNHGRALKLRNVNKDYLSDNELDQFVATLRSQEAQLELAIASISQATANVENSRTNLGYTKIISPVNGIVIDKKVEDGQTVASSFQTPELFVIAPDMDKAMHVFASVDEADIGLIRGAQERNQIVRFTVDAYPEELFEGKIHQIRRNSTTTQNVVTYPVVIEAPNPELKLLPGMTANISFQINAKEDVLRVPTAAFLFFPQPWQVHPEDRPLLEGRAERPGEAASSGEGTGRLSASDKAAAARNRLHRLVWVQEGEFLRGVKVVVGLSDSRFAELVEGDLAEGQAVVTGTDSGSPPTPGR